MLMLWGSKLKFFLSELEALRSENASQRGEAAFLRQLVEEERLERKQLTDLVLAKSGFVTPLSAQRSNEQYKPIGRAVTSWPRLKEKLENASRIEAKLTPREKDWAETVKSSEQEVAQLIDQAEHKNAS